MQKPEVPPMAEAADGAKQLATASPNSLISKAVNTKKSINAYLKGEITLAELNARGIKFVRTI